MGACALCHRDPCVDLPYCVGRWELRQKILGKEPGKLHAWDPIEDERKVPSTATWKELQETGT